MITVTETRTIEPKLLKCICGNEPDINSYDGYDSSVSVTVECTCGMSCSDRFSRWDRDFDIESCAQTVAYKWNRMMQPVEDMRKQLKENK